ncbi:MAG TPA: universal stress protein [Methylomirabilota bacterium]|nr:universal stress protein [Methylomirabilota bacterium]
MNPWLVLLALIVLAAAFVVAPVAAASLSYWRRAWLVRCPQDGAEARIAVNARRAALAEVLGGSGPEIVRCTLWRTLPSLRPCGQECLARPISERRPAGPRWHRGAGVRTIVVPLDGAPGSESVLQTAADLARAHGASVRLVRVEQPPSLVYSLDDRIVAYSDQESARIEQEARRYLAGIARGLPDLPVDLVVRFGDSATEIAEEAEKADADLITMATHRRRGVMRALKGSVAERVARSTDIPLVLVPYGPPAAA